MSFDAPPPVTVIMSVFNAEEFVDEAIESIVGQSLTDFDFIIVDDGSQDRSQERIRDHDDRRIRLVVNEHNVGLVESLNRGIALSRSPLIARMDADDVSEPDRLERQSSFLDGHSEVIGLSGAMRVIDRGGRSGRVIRPPTDDACIRRYFDSGENPMHHPAAMFRRSELVKIGGYRSVFRHAEDFDLWLRLAERGRLANLPEILLRYRVHPGQVSFVEIEQQELSAAAAVHAARERAAGRPDPFQNAALADRKALSVAGVDVLRVELRVVDRFRAAVQTALDSGQLQWVLDAASALEEVVFAERHARRVAGFEARWARAKGYRMRNDRVRAVLAALALLRHPWRCAARFVGLVRRGTPTLAKRGSR